LWSDQATALRTPRLIAISEIVPPSRHSRSHKSTTIAQLLRYLIAGALRNRLASRLPRTQNRPLSAAQRSLANFVGISHFVTYHELHPPFNQIPTGASPVSPLRPRFSRRIWVHAVSSYCRITAEGSRDSREREDCIRPKRQQSMKYPVLEARLVHGLYPDAPSHDNVCCPTKNWRQTHDRRCCPGTVNANEKQQQRRGASAE
jgi:hypothetical protein